MSTPVVSSPQHQIRIADLTPEMCQEIHRSWAQASAKPFDRARDKLADMVEAASDELFALYRQIDQAITEGRIPPEYVFTVRASVRWAWLANAYPDTLTKREFTAVTGGWKTAA